MICSLSVANSNRITETIWCDNKKRLLQPQQSFLNFSRVAFPEAQMTPWNTSATSTAVTSRAAAKISMPGLKKPFFP